MTFDQQILLWCVVVPVLIAGAACWAGQSLKSRRPESRWGDVVVAGGWWLAVTVALAARQGWQWWPDEAWRQAIWPILVWTILFSGWLAPQQHRPWVWVVAAALACATALVAMPSGEEWSDTYDLHRGWMCAVATSCLLNGFAICCMAHHGAARWALLVAMTAPAGSLLLAGSAYGSLAEWALAIAVATMVVALWGVFSTSINAWVVAFGVLAAAASVTAAARFYTYEDHPHWVYGAALYGPVLVAIVDSSMRGRSTWLRVTVSGVASLALLGSCLWAVLLR